MEFNKPKLLIYLCSSCDNKVIVRLDDNNLTYYKKPKLYCKNDLQEMIIEVIRENSIRTEEKI